MSARPLTLAATATAVATAAVCGVLLAPAASADTPTGLTAAISDVTHTTVTRGHGQDAFTLTVTNNSATAQSYAGQLVAMPAGGPSPLEKGQVTLDVQPLSAPATGSATMSQNPALIDQFFPQGTDTAHPFQVPAGTSYSWRVTVAFGVDFPGNDDGLDVTAAGGGNPKAHFDLSPALPDGSFTESFSRAVTVAPGMPGTTTLVLDNEAGGKFTKPLTTLIEVYPTGPGLGLDVRAGGAWVPAAVIQPGEWKLPQLPAGFAHGQKHTYELRFSTTGKPAAAKDIKLTSLTWLGSPIADAQTTLHLVPASAPATPTTPATTPAPASTPATTTPGTAQASSSAAAAPAADTGTPSPSATGALAHTGSSSHTGLFAGIAALLAAAGAAMIAVTARRRNGNAHR